MISISPAPWTLGPSWVEGPTGTFTYTNPGGAIVPDDNLSSAIVPDADRYYRIRYTISGTNPRDVFFADHALSSGDAVEQASQPSSRFNVFPFQAGGAPGDQIVVSGVQLDELPATVSPIQVMNSAGTTSLFTSPGSMTTPESTAVLPDGTFCVAQPIGFGAGAVQIYTPDMAQVIDLAATGLTSTFVTTDGTQFFVLQTTDDVGTALLRLVVLNADGTVDRTVDIQNDAGPLAFVPYSVAVTPDGATLYVGHADAIATVDTTTGVIGADFATNAGSLASYGGVRVLSNGDVLVLWQTMTAPKSFTLTRYNDGGVVQATSLLWTWGTSYATTPWAMPLLVTPDEASVWVMASGIPSLIWTPWASTKYAVSSLALQTTLTTGLLMLDGFVAPVEYRIPN